MKGRHNLTIFLDNFSTSFRRNSTRKIVRWFEELINLNHRTIFITEFHQKLVEVVQKNSAISLALIAARSVFHLTLRRCETHSQCVSLTLPRAPLKLSLLHSIVFHIALRQCETHSQCVSLAPPREPLKLSLLHSIVFHIALRLCETPPSPPAPDPVGIENCKQFFLPCSGDDVRRMCCYFLRCKCKQWWKKLFTVFDTGWVRGKWGGRRFT